jgi:hypothetical protein
MESKSPIRGHFSWGNHGIEIPNQRQSSIDQSHMVLIRGS